MWGEQFKDAFTHEILNATFRSAVRFAINLGHQAFFLKTINGSEPQASELCVKSENLRFTSCNNSKNNKI